jgi:hypothetical protein
MAINLALRPNAGPEAARTAASAVLRFKGLQTEEEAYLAQIVRRGGDPKAQSLAQEIATLRGRLATLHHSGGQAKQVEQLRHDLDARELSLGRLSRNYQRHLQVRNFNLRDLQQAVADRMALLEIRQYRPITFAPFTFGEPRWAGLLLTRDSIRVLDLGPVAETPQRVAVILAVSTALPAGRRHRRFIHSYWASWAMSLPVSTGSTSRRMALCIWRRSKHCSMPPAIAWPSGWTCAYWRPVGTCCAPIPIVRPRG